MLELLALLIVVVVTFQLRRRLNALELKLTALERRIAATQTAGPQAIGAAEADDARDSAAARVEPPPIIEPEAEAELREAPEPAADQPAGPPETPQPPRPSFEERFGTRWVVWVGGVALALGGVFLVRYSIEQGLIGPSARIALGALFSATLIAAGEWTRRRERASGIMGIATAHIPSILTAAGTVAAFATVYAAYALYDFLSPAAAFFLLGVVALATLAAALLHGPALAGLGLVGAEATPFLVAAQEPNFWALYLYLGVVTAATLALARVRLWRWLAIVAVVAAALWSLPGIDVPAALTPLVFHVLMTFGLIALLIVSGVLFGPPAIPESIEAVSSGALGTSLLVSTLVVLGGDHDGATLFAFAVVAAGTVVLAWRTTAATAAVPAGAVCSALVMVAWPFGPPIASLVAPPGPVAGLYPEPSAIDYGMALVAAGAFSALYGVSGYLAQGRFVRAAPAILWAAAGVFAPLAILVALYGRITEFERSLPFAGLALLLAALFAAAVDTLSRREPRPGVPAATAIFATGSLAALALALTFALERGWLTIALALMVPGTAYVAAHRPLPILRWLSAALTVIVAGRIGWDPRIAGADVGTTPIFNWILYGYGVPAAAFWIAGRMMRPRGDDLPARIVEAGAILFTVLVTVLEIRHYMSRGDIYAPVLRNAEVGVLVCAGLALTIGLEWVRGRTGSIVHNVGAIVVGALTVVMIVVDLGLAASPLFNANPVGGVFFNTILIGYGMPAVLAITLALIARTTRPMAYRAIAAVTAVVLALAYLSLQVKRVFRGPVMWQVSMTDAEQYTYSAVWLAFGIALLAVGFVLASKPARLASAAVVTLTIAKVFLIDMSDLTGIWRALSFIGLGLVLVAIGYAYQKLLFARPLTPPPAPGEAPPQPAA